METLPYTEPHQEIKPSTSMSLDDYVAYFTKLADEAEARAEKAKKERIQSEIELKQARKERIEAEQKLAKTNAELYSLLCEIALSTQNKEKN